MMPTVKLRIVRRKVFDQQKGQSYEVEVLQQWHITLWGSGIFALEQGGVWLDVPIIDEPESPKL